MFELVKKKPKKKSIKNKNNKKGITQKIGRFIIIAILIIYGLSAFYSFSEPNVEEISLSQTLEKIKNAEVEKITILDDNIEVKTKDNKILYSQKEPGISFTEILQNADIDPTELDLNINNQNLFKSVSSLIVNVGPIILSFFFFWYLFKKAGNTQNSIFSFGKSKAKFFRKNGKADFNDVAGLEESKEEIKEVVDFLKHPKKYQKIGARTPKGVLLIGPSGTGKTLMARAVAGEAKVPFLHMAGSEFMEMLVGIGASRVRDLFKTAKKSKKAIIFIDELDAIGGRRGSGMSPGHSEREQTLNQLLVEMDGLEANETIVVLAATNRPDILDPALIRPGRFDRRITLNLPDLEERQAILKLHAKGKPFIKRLSWKKVAKRTVGFSGADLENMLNEAAILTARTGKSKIGYAEINEASIKTQLGPQKKRMISEKEKRISAYHESGHAITSHFSPQSDPVERISIISRGRALGYTLMPPEKDKVHQNRTELLSRIISLMGGRAAEEIVFKEMTSGAAQDIKHATQLARKMVVQWGMSDLGPLYFGPQMDITEWGQTFYKPDEISPETQTKVDSAITKIINRCHKQAKTLIKKYRKQLDAVSQALMEKETLEREEFEEIIRKN